MEKREISDADLHLNGRLTRMHQAIGGKVVFDAIRQPMTRLEPKKRKIGFTVKERAVKYRRRKVREASRNMGALAKKFGNWDPEAIIRRSRDANLKSNT